MCPANDRCHWEDTVEVCVQQATSDWWAPTNDHQDNQSDWVCPVEAGRFYETIEQIEQQ